MPRFVIDKKTLKARAVLIKQIQPSMDKRLNRIIKEWLARPRHEPSVVRIQRGSGKAGRAFSLGSED